MDVDDLLTGLRLAPAPDELKAFDGSDFARAARRRRTDLRMLTASVGGIALCMGVVGGMPRNAPSATEVSIDSLDGVALAPSTLLGAHP